MTKILRNLFLALMVILPFLAKGQCDVFIVPGSVEVLETEDAVMFTFDVTNNSDSEWMGDDILMYWSLNSGANIMSIEYGDGSDPGHPPPLAPGQTTTFNTPWMAIPNLPEWYPENPSNDNPWLESMDWPFYTLSFPFNGAWSPINLRLASCGLGDGAWIYDDVGELYYGPQNNSICQDLDDNAYCDCDITVTGYDQDNFTVSVEINSSYNCGCNSHTDDNFMDCYDNNIATPEENTYIDHLVFGLNVQTLDEDWLGCLDNSYHEGWVFGILNFALNPLESGDMVSEQIQVFNDCWQTMQDLAPNSLCLQMVVWQINFSATAYAYLDYDGTPGWAATCGVCNFDTQAYPDIDISDNLVVWCFDEDPPIPDILGCMDPTANNYNSEANVDDESCTFDVLGCTDPVACNYNSEANVFDDSCIYCGPDCIWENPNICEGCTDPEANNYSETAIYDDGSCQYNDFIDLALDTILYEVGCDENGPFWNSVFYLSNLGTEPITEFCIKNQVLGQSDDTTCFDAFTILPGETYELNWPNVYSWGVLSSHILHVNGANDNWWIQFGQDDNIGNNMYVQIINDQPECTSPDAKPVSINEYYDCIDNQVVIMNDVQIQNLGGDTLFTYCIEIPEINYNQCFDGYQQGLYWIEPGAGQIFFNTPPIPADLDFITIIVYEVGDELVEDSYNNTIQVDFSHDDQPEDCTDLQYSNASAELFCDSITPYYTPTLSFINTGLETITSFCASLDLFSTLYDEQSCWNGTLLPGDTAYLEFENVYMDAMGGWITINVINQNSANSTPLVITDLSDAWNQAQELCEIYGCTIVQACNYNPEATVNDGSCDFESCVGCTDPEAINYDPIATEDNGSCVYPIYGCTDPTAFNYNPLANTDDGSCEEIIVGCMIADALNYDPNANVTCVPINECCEFEPELTYVNAECSVDCDLNGPFYYVITTWTNTGYVEITNFCVEWDVLGGPGDIQECYNGSLMPGDTTLLTFGPYSTNGSPVAWAYLQVINGVELVPQIENYETLYCYGDAEASCVYGCTDQEANNYDSTADVDDGSCTYDILGCTDPEANNFNSEANVDDGSCTYDVLGCTDASANNYNPFANVDDGSCQYDVFGCTDSSALNYNPFANIDDGSCLYYDPCDEEDIPVYVPNVFTPNGDGINEVWQIITNKDCWLDWDVKIFNRWGNMIYSMTSPDEVWDGTVVGKDRLVSDGVYVCRIIARGKNARVFETTTDITVFK